MLPSLRRPRCRSASGLRLALVLTTLVALAPSPAAAWLFTFPASRTTAARDLAFAPDGTIVAAGSLALSIERPYVVIRLDPEDGSTTGFYFHGFGHDGQANAVAMHGDEAIAAGEVGSAADASRFVVTRSTADGGEVWATELDGTASCGDDVANAVAVDPDGDVLAGGTFTNAGVETTVSTFALVKLALADGSVAWRREIDDGVVRALVLDGADVVAVGGIGGSFSVVKVNGLTGDVVWRTDLGAGEGAAIVAGAPGTVYVAGQVGGSFGVAKLATDTGAALWPNDVATIAGPGVGRAIALVPGGDVAVAGETGADPARLFVTARFDAATGSIVWTDADPSTPQPAAAYGVAVGAVDHVVSVGTAAWDMGPASFASRSVAAADAHLQWGNGILSDDAETRATVVRFDANGDVVQGGQLALFGYAPGFTVRKLHGADGSDYQPLCGNDQLDPGEECDDANRVDGDCCSSKCKFEAAGSPCPDDGNDCSADLCDGQGTCTHAPVTPGTSCDDANDCTLGDHCNSDGVCVATSFADVGTPCNADFNDCTTDACNQTGQCIATPNNDPCDDLNPCTTGDTCAGGFCFGAPQTGGSCDDFNPCTANDTCQQGFCSGTFTAGLPCFDDGNPCTDDVCGVETCEHHPNTAPCDDADACTGDDHCENGACVGTAGTGTSTTTSSTSSTSTSTSSTSSTATTSTSTSSTSTSSTTHAPTTTTSTSSSTVPSTSTTTRASTTTSTSSTSSSSTSSSTSTTTSTTSTTIPHPGAGCADGTREGLTDVQAFPYVAACAGVWTGPVADGAVLCEEGWHVCNPDDEPVLQTVTYQDATAFPGCFAYDAAEDGNTCQPCAGTASADDMAGMGQSCTYYASGAASCIAGGRVDATCCSDYTSGTACQFKPNLTTGVVCCLGAAPTTTSTTSTTSTSSSLPTTPSTSSSTTTVPVPTTTTLPRACTTAADCDDGDPCNGGEPCVDGRCGVSSAVTANACRGADPLAIVTSFGTDAVVVCNTRTRTVETTVPVGRAPWGIAWRPAGDRVFVTNREDATVSVIDMATRTVVGTVPVDPQPLGIAVHPFLPRAYVASYKTDKIDVIDTSSLSVVDTIAVGNGPSGVAVHPAGASLYVANYIAGTVSVIDVASGAVTATIATPTLPVGVAIHPAGTKAYVACLKGREIAVVGTVSDTLLRTVRVGRAPIGVAFDVAGARAYVTNSADDTVTVLDAGADKAVAKIHVGHFPLGVAVSGDGTVWVADSRANELALLDAGGTTSATIAVPDTPVSIGSFIGTPPSGCPAPPLPCDDANPFTGDACKAGVGCTQAPIPGVDGVRAGVSAIGAILAEHPDDPIAGELAPLLPALESAVEAAQTGGDRTALRLVRKTLKPVLTALERARRHGTLGSSGAQLLDIAREARRELKKLGRRGNTA